MYLYTEDGHKILRGQPFRGNLSYIMPNICHGVFATTFFHGNGILEMVLQTSRRLALLHRLLKSILNASENKNRCVHAQWRKSSSLNEYLSVLSILAPICVIFHNMWIRIFRWEFECIFVSRQKNVTLCKQSMIDLNAFHFFSLDPFKFVIFFFGMRFSL